MGVIIETFQTIFLNSFVIGLIKIIFFCLCLVGFYYIVLFFRFPWRVSNTVFADPQRVLIFGRPGQGKTTLLVYKMIEALRDGKVVLSNQAVKWYGYAFRLTPFHKYLNKCIKWLFTTRFYVQRFNIYHERQTQFISDVKYKLDNLYDDDGYMKYDPTTLRKEIHHAEEVIEQIENFREDVDCGFIKEIEFPQENFIFEEDLSTAIATIIEMSLKDRSIEFFLGWDEGFAYLDSGKKVDPFITNFFNQSRKLNCSCFIASQRPVAVYPSFRALTDFMVLVKKKKFNRYSSTRFYVDTNESALPDLNKINSNSGFFSALDDNSEKGEKYINYKGRDVYYYFDTRQSFALNKLLEQYRRDKMTE